MELNGKEIYSPVPCTRDTAHKTFGPTDLTSTFSVCTRRVFGGIGHRTQAFRHKEIDRCIWRGVLTVRQCQNWFATFRSGNFDVEDAQRSEKPVEADKDAIKALVDANRRITTQRNLCRRIDVCDSLLKRHENDPFLRRIITGDENGHGAKKMNRLRPFPKPIFTKKEELLHKYGRKNPGRPSTVDSSTRLTEHHFMSHIPLTLGKLQDSKVCRSKKDAHERKKRQEKRFWCNYCGVRL
ncbi:HTH_48 domain-containing protein [Trichonephila clavipes]|nr:HTH_48 domain-containing protein [Trichonephila clavipes]